MAMQSKTATFTGAEDYIDIVWPVAFPATSTFRRTRGVTIDAADVAAIGGGLAVALIPTPAVDISIGLRVQPSDRFTGTVDVFQYEV